MSFSAKAEEDNNLFAFIKSVKNLPVSIKHAIDTARHWWGPGFRDPDPEVISCSKKEKVYLSVKQVPSCLMLRNPGSRSVLANWKELDSLGFKLDVSRKLTALNSDESDSDGEHHVSASQISALNSLLSSNSEFNRTVANTGPYGSSFNPLEEEEYESESSKETSSDDSSVEPRERSGAIIYEDPFVTNASIIYAKSTGKPAPEVFVWEGDVIRLTDKIPPRLIKVEDWKNIKSNRGIPFYEITSTRAKMHVLLVRTYWGRTLKRFAKDHECEEHRWSKCLIKRIKYLLEGKHDPNWSSKMIVDAYGTRNYKPRNGKSRGLRLLQVLLTIDGIFQQRYLSTVSEAWTWQKFDRFVLGLLNELIGDEFLDGDEGSEDLLDIDLVYTRLKRVRQFFKDQSNSNVLTREKVENHDLRMMFCYRALMPSFIRYLAETDTDQKFLMRGILSQTRGAGTPPPLACLQSKVKCLRTFCEPSPPLTKTEEKLLKGTIKNVVNSLPDEPFTGLATKAGISVTASACYEKTREEGGTIEAISTIVMNGRLGEKAHAISLETGDYERELELDDRNPGEYVFWKCLEIVLATPPETLTTVFMVVANEPGKARTVTKGSAALKVVLDVVNAICSWPMHKAFESSKSGMSKEAHGWNFFKMFFASCRDTAFRPKQVVVQEIGNVTETSVVYHDVYVSSTDYETATDYEGHYRSEIMGRAWMTKCGIPRLLQGIVVQTCYRPRRVEFTSIGVLKNFGKRIDERTSYITTCRGIMMGDPLTKVILHLTNICVREAASKVTNHAWLEKFCNNPSDVVGCMRREDIVPAPAVTRFVEQV